MNRGKISMYAALVTAVLCVSTAHVNAMTANASTGLSQAVTLNDGTTGVPTNNLAVLGVFKNNMSNAAISALWTGTNVGDIANITAAFNVWASGTIGPDAPGEVNISSGDPGLNYFTSNAFVIVYNAATAAAATQVLVLKGPTSGTSSGDPWVFPSTDFAAAISMSLDDLTASNVLIGSYSVGTYSDGGTWFSDPANSLILAAVPVPLTAGFTASPTNGAAPLGVTFADSSTGTITNRFWNFGDGATVNTNVTSLMHTYSSAGVFDVSLTVFGPDGTDTLSRSSYITATNGQLPVITSGATVSNAPLQVGNLIVVVAGVTNTFSISATDPDSNPLSYQWSFGDGVTNAWSPSNSVDHAYTTNCGPYEASVTISNGVGTISSNFTIVVACQLNLAKLAPKLNFAKTNSDSCTITGAFELPPNPSFAGKQVTLDIGGGSLTFTLPSKGSAVNGKSKFSTPTFNKKTGQWKLNASFKNGFWQTEWANYSMINSNVPKPGVLVPDLPVILLLDNEAFMATTNLHYTAKQGKSGTAK